MQRDKLRQGNNADRDAAGESQARRGLRAGQVSPAFRSPALESVERQKRQQVAASGREQTPRSANRGRNQEVRYAAEDTLRRPGPKSLPRFRGAADAAISGTPARSAQPLGQVEKWRARAYPPVRTPRMPATPPPAPVQVMSDEEQKKLSALEMQLPRTAGKHDPLLLIVVLVLLCIGLVMVYSASSFVAARCCGDVSYYFQKQFLGALLGLAAMLVTMRVDYRRWRRLSLFGMAIVLPLLVIVLKFGTSAYGASRWLTFGSFLSFQPSEVVKLVLAFYVADWLARKGNQVGTFLYGLAPFVILVGLILGLVLLENDMGTAIVIAGLATVMFFTAGANILQFMLALGCGGLIFTTQAFQGYRYLRLMGFMNPFVNVDSINLQLYQSLLALGSGGWFGLGLGASRQKTGYLPLPHIDSIFAIIGEELGFIGCAIVVLLFVALAFRGFRLARRTQDVYGALLATGITTWLVLQAMINIGATSGSIPYTGVPLPFISYGGTSLVVSMAAIGVLLNISKYIQEPEKPAFSRYTITRTIKKKV